MKKDGTWKKFFSNPSRYADAINGFGCGGRQLVTEEDLHDVDTQIAGIKIPKFVTQSALFAKPKFRDMVQKVAFDINFAIIGIENQETTDYSLPLRNMLYDVAEYEKQAVKIRRDIRKRSGEISTGEYLYGFTKDSKLFPVVTFVLYTGEDTWEGPLCLHDMLDFTNIPKELQKLIPNYTINVISVKDIKDTSIFHTDLREILDFLRFSKDEKKLLNLVENNPYYQNMDEDAYDVIANYANIEKIADKKEFYIEDGGGINMCTAIKNLMEDSKLEGKLEGELDGFVKALQAIGQSDDDIVAKLCENFDITPDGARERIAQIKH